MSEYSKGEELNHKVAVWAGSYIGGGVYAHKNCPAMEEPPPYSDADGWFFIGALIDRLGIELHTTEDYAGNLVRVARLGRDTAYAYSSCLAVSRLIAHLDDRGVFIEDLERK